MTTDESEPPGTSPPSAALEAFRNRLRKSWAHRRKWAKARRLTAFRVYDSDIPEVRCVVEWHAGHAQVADYARRGRDESEEDSLDGARGPALAAVVAEVLGLPTRDVVLKTRAPKAWREEQYEKLGQGGERFVVEEGDLRFLVNLTDHLDTGLFLDHRGTRALVRRDAPGRSFLNLFCYTASFTVAAAKGGAASSLSVDLSNTYLDWAQDNLRLNAITGSQHELLRSDVTRWARQARGRSFDLVVLDPPSYSASKKMTASFEVQRDHATLVQDVQALLAPGGILYFSTSYRSFRPDPKAFEGFREVRELTPKSLPEDFHDRRIHRCWRLVR